MFGFVEEEFKVQATHTRPDSPRRYELREASLSGTYIALTDQADLDVLFLYETPAQANLDWARIQAGGTPALSEMNHFERVENHHIGYRRDGGIVLY